MADFGFEHGRLLDLISDVVSTPLVLIYFNFILDRMGAEMELDSQPRLMAGSQYDGG